MYRAHVRPEPDPGRRIGRSEIVHSNIPFRYANGSLDLIADEAPHKEQVLAFARAMHETEKGGLGLVLSGDVGTGKSTIACQLLIWVLIRSAARCYYVESTEIPSLAIEKPRTDDGESVWELLRGMAQLLVIDDLGNDKNTDWGGTVFRRVLNGRYGHKMPTIITTNLSRDELFERVPRLSELFGDAYEWIDVAGEPWREDE